MEYFMVYHLSDMLAKYLRSELTMATDGVQTRVGPAEKSLNLHLSPINRNYLQVNPTFYLLAKYVLQFSLTCYLLTFVSAG